MCGSEERTAPELPPVQASTASNAGPKSPGGLRLTFASYRDDPTNSVARIYVMNADGSSQVALTDDPAGDADPEWSPDGKRIAFNRATAPGETDEINIFSARFDGTDPQQLTTGTACNRFPDWSDGAARRR